MITIKIRIRILKEHSLDFRKIKSQPINLRIGKLLIKFLNLHSFILKKILKMLFNLMMEIKAIRYNEKNKNNLTDMCS